MSAETQPRPAMEDFDFEAAAIFYYNDNKADAENEVSSYDELFVVSTAAVKARQRAAANEQAHLLELLGAKYKTPIFQGLSEIKEKSRDSDSDATTIQDSSTNSPSIGSDVSKTSETSTAVETAQYLTDISNKVRKLHRKADNLIKDPGQGVAGAVQKIFERITIITDLATSGTVQVPKKTQSSVKRECLQVVVKLYTQLPTLAINAKCGWEFRDAIKKKQTFVEKKDDWKDFVAAYQEIMATTGSAHPLVKTAMEQLAAAKKANAAANGNVPVPTGPTTAAATTDTTAGPTNGNTAPLNPVAAAFDPNTIIDGKATDHNDSGFVDGN